MYFKFLLLFCFVLFSLVHGSQLKKQYPIRRNSGALRPPMNFRKSDFVETKYFNQYLDHFTPTDTTKWKQLYYTNNEFHRQGGPAFIFIGGESPAGIGWMTSGFWIEQAQHFNAVCFQLEHRYYGSSQPKGNLSVENMKYLTSEQALADLAYFIKSMNVEYNLPKETKWVAFGGSYAGNLASWLRYKYPHLVHAAVASSGPVYAKPDYFEYLEVVANSLVYYNPQCLEPIRQATQQMEKILKESSGRTQIEKIFQTCNGDLKTDNDLGILFQTLSQDFAGVVQYNLETNSVNINTLCEIMTNASYGEPIQRYSQVHKFLNNLTPDQCIVTTYDNLIKYVREENVNYHFNGGRQWIYQTCTEYGFYQTSSQKDQIWGTRFPLELYIQECEDMFDTRFTGEFLNSVIENSNRMFGTRDIQATRVVYVHGSIDPWHILGLYNSTSTEAPSIFIKGGSHCADMYSSSNSDPESINTAHKQIQQYLDEWL